MLEHFPFKFPVLEIIDIAIEGAKKIWGAITGKGDKQIEEISNKDSLNEGATSEIIDYNSLINDFVMELKEELDELEKNAMKEVLLPCEELLDLINAFEQSKGINLHSRNVERNIKRVKRQIEGSLFKGISRKLALDNQELKGIFKLPAGEKKKERLNVFRGELIQNSINELCDEISELLNDLQEEISDDITLRIEDICRKSETLSKDIEFIDANKDDEEKINELVNVAKQKMVLSDEVMNYLK